MGEIPSQSPIDHAYTLLKIKLKEQLLIDSNASDLTEADTRAKFIDPLFKEVLGWTEQDIRREKPVSDGYVDYVIGAEFPYFHIEAKRLNPRFRLQCKSKARVLSLSGPHLLKNKKMADFIEQTARYAFELGTDFTVLTNGDQFILFKTRLEGKSWRYGHAYIWHDIEDILKDFTSFYNALSADNVRAGSLNQLFSNIEGIYRTYFVPRQFIYNPDREYVRNRFWNMISAVFGSLLSDQPEDEELQLEIIRNCYVSTPLSDQAYEQINNLLSDKLPRFLQDTKVVDIGPGQSEAFHSGIEEDIKARKAATYILTGGVGSGKTTFLKRYAKVMQPKLIKRYCIWIHIDYLTFGTIDFSSIGVQIEEFTFNRIRETLKIEYKDLLPDTGDTIRELFSRQIGALKLTLLYGIDESSPEWNHKVNELVDSLYRNDKSFVEAFLFYAAKIGKRIVIVLDNSDQQGEAFQEALFLFSQKISRELGALTIVALREEKYFVAYRRGIFDAYGDKRFHIGSPNLQYVLKKRLQWGVKKYQSFATERNIDPKEVSKVLALIKVFIWSTTEVNQNIVRMLACVSNGDMRYALGMFREFVSSGNTNIEKILDIVDRYAYYTVPFHEFAKSAILGSRKFYRGDRSHIINVFVTSGAVGASHLTACRILERLAKAQSVVSAHGEGFVETYLVLREYRQAFGMAEDLILRTEELLRRGLLESEPPRVSDLKMTEALRISAAGAYYWHYLIRAFAYLDLVYVDTPIANRDLVQHLAGMAEESILTIRFRRVRDFLEYLDQEEKRELSAVDQPENPFATPIIHGIKGQIEKEIVVIMEKTGLT
jgi:hypothetical protein